MARHGSDRQRREMDRSANGAKWIGEPTARNGSERQRREMDRSANGAKYESLGHRPRDKVKESFESAESAKYKVSDKTTLIGIRACYSAPSALGAFNGFHLGRWPRLSYVAPLALPIHGN